MSVISLCAVSERPIIAFELGEKMNGDKCLINDRRIFSRGFPGELAHQVC